MTATEFRAAVERVIGVPLESDFAKLPIPNNTLELSLFKWPSDPFGIGLQFGESPSPGVGESQFNGNWGISGVRFFNNDPEAVLRELVARLAKAGYQVPAVSPPAEVKPGLCISINTPARVTPTPGSLAFSISEPDAGFQWHLDGTTVSQVPVNEPKPDVPVSGCVIGLTEEERQHLTALMETAIEPEEDRPRGIVGQVWADQQDAWRSILQKLKP